MLERDVTNITQALGYFAPELLTTDYAGEMWALFEHGELQPDSRLTGIHERSESAADVDDVLVAIDDAREEAMRRQLGRDDALADLHHRSGP